MKKLWAVLGVSLLWLSCQGMPSFPPSSNSKSGAQDYPVATQADYPAGSASSPANVTRVASTEFSIPFKTGNLGILEPLEAKKKGKRKAMMRDLNPLKGLRQYGLSSMEDYIPWFWLEPEKSKFNWRIFDHHYQKTIAAGMKYALYPFVHFVPDWVTKEKDFQGFVCLKHNKATTFPSIFAPSTLQYYDRYYKILSDHFGGKISQFYVAGTADFGEVGYPHGVEVWDAHHMHPGWWINDPYARSSFADYLKKKFGGVDALNKRWTTGYRTFEEIPYPRDSKNRLRWLDFMDWYNSSQTDFMVELVKLAKKYFPGIPLEIKLGHPYETPIYGKDVAGLFKAGKQYGFTVRSTAAFVPPQVYGRIAKKTPRIVFFLGNRQASLAEFYGLRFVTEEFAGMPKAMSLARIFNDASFGVDEVYIGPPSLMAALDYYKRFGAFIRGDQAITQTAFYYPLTDHMLKPEEELPRGVFNAGNELREQINYNVVDDAMILENALDRYQFLVFFDLGVMKGSVLKAMEAWVQKGGILVHPFAGESLDVLEGNAADYENSLFKFDRNSQVTFQGNPIYFRKLGAGGVAAVSISGSLNKFYPTVVSVVTHGNELVPGAKLEPGVDLADDQVYASVFEDRVLWFNSGKRTVTKSFTITPQQVPSLKESKKFTLNLQPLSIQEVRFAEGTTAPAAAASTAAPAAAASSSQPAATSSAEPADMETRIRGKIQRFQSQMPLYVSGGGNPNRVRSVMDEFQRLMQSGKPQQAEKKLDEALSIIGAH